MCYRMVVSLTGSGRKMSFGSRPRCRAAVGGRGRRIATAGTSALGPGEVATVADRITGGVN
jgi:hypothetical protein